MASNIKKYRYEGPPSITIIYTITKNIKKQLEVILSIERHSCWIISTSYEQTQQTL